MRSCTKAEKTLIIRRLQASANNLKAILLENGHAVRAFEEHNTKLTSTISCAKQRTNTWMITCVVTLLILCTMLAYILK